MARLNIEDQFWLDAMAIMSKFANQDEAIGNAVRFFRYAQDKHKNGEYLSEDEFKRLGFSEALFPTFAERSEHGILVRGAEKHFGWLKARAEAGRKGAEKTNAKKKEVQQTTANDGKARQPTPSYSSSYSKEINNTAAPAKAGRRKQLDLVKFESVGDLKAALPHDKCAEWGQLYPDPDYLQREIMKAFGYYRDNPRKCPTTMAGWKRTLGSWFERGWAKHVAGIPSNATPSRFNANQGPRPITLPNAQEVFKRESEERERIEREAPKLTPEEQAKAEEKLKQLGITLKTLMRPGEAS